MPDYICYVLPASFPDNLCVCPVCSGRVISEDTSQSKALQKIITGNDYYLFSHLYLCNTCQWWCIRERFEIVDVTTVNWLILSTLKRWEPTNYLSSSPSRRKAKAWLKALEDEKVYDVLQELPKELEIMFTNGKTYQEFEQ